MAKKKQPEAAVTPSEVIKVPSAAVLKRLMAAKRSTMKDVAELTGTFAQQVQVAVKDHNLHKVAFGFACRLDKMEPEALKETLDHLEHYLEAGGLRKRAASVQRMPLEEEDEEGGEDSNVRAFPNQPAA